MASGALSETTFAELVVGILRRNNGEVAAAKCCMQLYALNSEYTAFIKEHGGLKKLCSRNPERLQFVDDGGCGVLRLAVSPRRESDISDPYILRTDANRREQRVCSWFIGLHHPLLPSLRRMLRVWPLPLALTLRGNCPSLPLHCGHAWIWMATSLPSHCPQLSHPCPALQLLFVLEPPCSDMSCVDMNEAFWSFVFQETFSMCFTGAAVAKDTLTCVRACTAPLLHICQVFLANADVAKGCPDLY
jgi:hypothetical protein